MKNLILVVIIFSCIGFAYSEDEICKFYGLNKITYETGTKIGFNKKQVDEVNSQYLKIINAMLSHHEIRGVIIEKKGNKYYAIDDKELESICRKYARKYSVDADSLEIYVIKVLAVLPLAEMDCE